MTYNVFGGTLNPAQFFRDYCQKNLGPRRLILMGWEKISPPPIFFLGGGGPPKGYIS